MNETRRTHPLFRVRLPLLLCVFLMGASAGGPALEALLRQPAPAAPLPVIESRALSDQVPQETGDKMDINAATAEDLQQAFGVGPVLAQAVVDFREDLGGFYFLEEVKDVPGIGDARFQAIRALFYCPDP